MLKVAFTHMWLNLTAMKNELIWKLILGKSEVQTDFSYQYSTISKLY